MRENGDSWKYFQEFIYSNVSKVKDERLKGFIQAIKDSQGNYPRLEDAIIEFSNVDVSTSDSQSKNRPPFEAVLDPNYSSEEHLDSVLYVRLDSMLNSLYLEVYADTFPEKLIACALNQYNDILLKRYGKSKFISDFCCNARGIVRRLNISLEDFFRMNGREYIEKRDERSEIRKRDNLLI